MTNDETKRERSCYLGVQDLYNLNLNCIAIEKLYGFGVYLVGSVLTRLDYRDVDVRCILEDDEFDRMFGNDSMTEKRVRFHSVTISEWLRSRTSLPIDFQFQRQTEANRDFQGTRSALGIPL